VKKKHRSISQILDRSKSAESRRAITINWSKSWENETMELIRNLEQAVRAMDYDQLCINTRQLKAVTQKRFGALPNIFMHLTKAGAAEKNPEKEPEPLANAAVQDIHKKQDVPKEPDEPSHAEEQHVPGICIDCGVSFNAKTSRQKRCPECQVEHNKALRLAAAKATQDVKRDRPLLDIMEGYITVKEWASKHGKSPSSAQNILSNSPTLVPAARKVRNPRGGVDIWVVPKETIWP